MLNVVLGGPGCGKTTYLLQLIDDLLAKGVSPQQIGYLTFTRKAAREGLERASLKFELSFDSLPYFSTLHAFAYNQLGLSPAEVMSHTNYKEFGNHLGMEVTQGPQEGFLFEGSRRSAEKILSLVAYARITCQHLRDVCSYMKMDYKEAEWVKQSLELFKSSRGLVDFTDILQVYIEKGGTPHLEALIIDEAQDLSALQWKLVEKLAEHTPVLYFAGDDDQAIYQWAGADVGRFLALKGKKIVLPVSYRLKSNIFNVCQTAISNINKRYEKNWKPHMEGGSVARVNRLEHVEWRPGSWLVLARNRYLLDSAKEYFRAKGFPYVYENKSSIDNDHVRAVIIWETLRKGKAVTGEQAKLLYRNMYVRFVANKQPSLDDTDTVTLEQLMSHHGLLTKENWMVVMRIPQHDKDYYRDVKLRGESLIDAPRITIATIHGVKGGEADHVVLYSDMSYASYNELIKEPSSESRVFYVALSRAKDSLWIVNPLTPRFYPIGVTL